MQTQSLSTQGLKEILQKVIGQKEPLTAAYESSFSTPAATAPTQLLTPDIILDSAVETPVFSNFEPEISEKPENPILEPIETTAEEIVPAHIPANPEKPAPISSKTDAKLKTKLEEKDKQICELKKTIKELNSKALAEEKLKSALEKTKADLADLTQLTKTYEADTFAQKQQIFQLNQTITSLTRSLQDSQNAFREQEENLVHKIQTTSLDSQETKARLLRLIADKKELEDTITTLSCEKATLGARLQSLAQKNTKHEETESQLTEQIKSLTEALETITKELAALQEEHHEINSHTKLLDAQNQELTITLSEQTQTLAEQTRRASDLEHKNNELHNQLEISLQAHQQELAVTKACLQEQSHVLEEEQKKFRLLSQEHLFTQKRTEEQENHLRLLEQHLARRVKECALLSKQLEDLMDRTSQLQNSLNASHQKCALLEESLDKAQKLEQALRSEFDEQANRLQDELQAKDQQIQQYIQALEHKENELAALRRMQNQFSELENLIKRSAEIFTASETPTAPQNTPYIAAQTTSLTQKDIFSFPSLSKPQPKSLFD